MTHDQDGPRPGAPSDNTTLTAILDGLERAGYSVSFGARDGARLECSSCRDEWPAAELDVDSFRRLEGASDPDAQAIVVAGPCPRCGSRGTVALGYGPDSSEVDALVVAELDLGHADT